MDIFLSVNNREDILQIPVMPSSFTVTKPQTTEKFETVSGEEIMLIGEPKLKGIGIESIFPVREYSFLHHKYNPDMWGWDYVYKIDTWIKDKLPIRLIITYESKDTPINMPVAVTNFEYSVKQDGDLWYKIDFEQMNLLGYDNPQPWYDEEEIDMEELEKLKQEVAYLRGLVEELGKNPYANAFIYNYIDDNMPDWAKEAVSCAVNTGFVEGTGTDESGQPTLGLNDQDLRHIAMMYKGGVITPIYDYVDTNMPDWAKSYVQKAVDKGYITGKEVDENGNPKFGLTVNDLRYIAIMGRAGLFDTKAVG